MKFTIYDLRFTIGLLLASSFILHPSSVHADLTVTVTPGYVFGSNERPSTATLNRLGAPTIGISGTIGGTNAGIAAGSVNGAHFSDSVVDDRTLDFTNSSPRALRIKAEGVGNRELSTAIAGPGLAGGNGTSLSVNVDGLTVKTNGDTLYVPFDQSQFHTNGGVVTLSNFVSIEYSFAPGASIGTNHHLPTTPTLWHWVMVCKTNEFGYRVGDELSISSWYGTDNDVNLETSFVSGASTTNVFLTVPNSPTFPEFALATRNRTNGTRVFPNTNNWKAKAYARP